MLFIKSKKKTFNKKNILNINEDIVYSLKMTNDLTDDELLECSELFSAYYGKYNDKSAIRPGEQIKMSARLFRANYCKDNFYVATARYKDELVGQAFYMRKDYSKQGFGIMTWVLQLVVNKNYRKLGIASKLLQSIWGFSDDYAWGLATTNPCTVKTLESATFRKCKPIIVQKHLEAVRLLKQDIDVFKDAELKVSNNSSQINSNFFVDNSEFTKDKDCEERLGVLREGHEWLAFTFSSQGIQQESYKKHFESMVRFSELKLNEAYGRMKMSTHKWTRGTNNEIDFVLSYGTNNKIIDLGCGQGRHVIELIKRGYDVKGIDFNEKNICIAKEELGKFKNSALPDSVFICDDVRKYSDDSSYDKVICLYDVIGSFPTNDENERIVYNANKLLSVGGLFILSVMNMELTETLILNKNRGKIEMDSDILRKLPPSNTMQNSGNIFEPKYLALDTENDLIYRKEQFYGDTNLPAEYVIRDKRYRKKEIIDILIKYNFEIIDVRCVQAGHFDVELDVLDNKAKEICVVAKKKDNC